MPICHMQGRSRFQILIFEKYQLKCGKPCLTLNVKNKGMTTRWHSVFKFTKLSFQVVKQEHDKFF